MNARFLPPIPDGYNLFETDIEVAGLHATKADALAFADESDQSLELRADPSNPHDSNAMKVIGVSQRGGQQRRRMLGYLPRQVSARIAEGRFSLLPRLKNIWVSDSDFIVVRLDLMGPKADRDKYADVDAVVRRRPAGTVPPEVVYASHFGVRLSGGRYTHVAAYDGWYESELMVYILCRRESRSGERVTSDAVTCPKCLSKLNDFLDERIESTCSRCGASHRIARRHVGRKASCNRCHHSFRIESAPITEW